MVCVVVCTEPPRQSRVVTSGSLGGVMVCVVVCTELPRQSRALTLGTLGGVMVCVVVCLCQTWNRLDRVGR